MLSNIYLSLLAIFPPESTVLLLLCEISSALPTNIIAAQVNKGWALLFAANHRHAVGVLCYCYSLTQFLKSGSRVVPDLCFWKHCPQITLRLKMNEVGWLCWRQEVKGKEILLECRILSVHILSAVSQLPIMEVLSSSSVDNKQNWMPILHGDLIITIHLLTGPM